jgi:hypothetical protein
MAFISFCGIHLLLFHFGVSWACVSHHGMHSFVTAVYFWMFLYLFLSVSVRCCFKSYLVYKSSITLSDEVNIYNITTISAFY